MLSFAPNVLTYRTKKILSEEDVLQYKYYTIIGLRLQATFKSLTDTQSSLVWIILYMLLQNYIK